eukprot:561514-Pleurochrysis_carterae.AAC.1
MQPFAFIGVRTDLAVGLTVTLRSSAVAIRVHPCRRCVLHSASISHGTWPLASAGTLLAHPFRLTVQPLIPMAFFLNGLQKDVMCTILGSSCIGLAKSELLTSSLAKRMQFCLFLAKAKGVLEK